MRWRYWAPAEPRIGKRTRKCSLVCLPSVTCKVNQEESPSKAQIENALMLSGNVNLITFLKYFPAISWIDTRKHYKMDHRFLISDRQLPDNRHIYRQNAQHFENGDCLFLLCWYIFWHEITRFQMHAQFIYSCYEVLLTYARPCK